VTVAGRVKAYTVLDANEVRDKLRDLNVEGRIKVDFTEIPNEFIDWFWFSQGRNFNSGHLRCVLQSYKIG